MGNSSLTPEEVALSLNITKNTVYEMVKRGELTAYRVGRKIRVDEKELANYKEKMQKTNIYQEKAENSSFILCGQDIILDILCRHMEESNPNFKILRSHKGSYNGLYDLYNCKANAATAHLWDGDSNTYNEVYIKSMLPGVPAKIINLVRRYQGFYVKTGNPKDIRSWEDLSRTDIQFVNRERGSGTRVLLDEQLRLRNIKSNTLNGYEVIATSHISVASAVARGVADFGLGNQKAVYQVNGLEFIPLQQECYDLIVKEEDLNLPIIQTMIQIINSEEYRDEILGLGGYELF